MVLLSYSINSLILLLAKTLFCGHIYLENDVCHGPLREGHTIHINFLKLLSPKTLKPLTLFNLLSESFPNTAINILGWGRKVRREYWRREYLHRILLIEHSKHSQHNWEQNQSQFSSAELMKYMYKCQM